MAEYGIMVTFQEFGGKNMKKKKLEILYQILAILAVGMMVWMGLFSVVKLIIGLF